jgi:cobalt-zinc-cadmium efflux system outer membrane protein
MKLRHSAHKWFGIAGLAICLTGCRAARMVQDPEYSDLLSSTTQSFVDGNAPTMALSPISTVFEGPHPVEFYLAEALAQSPRVQAARKRVEAHGNRVPQAASLDDPMLNVNGYPFFPNVLQTAGGRSTVNVMASQKLPWFGKLETKAAAAEADTDVARSQLAAVELEVIEQVRRAYFELYFLQKSIALTEQSRTLLVDFAEIAESKYRTGEVSQQDVLRAQVEISKVDGELIRQQQQLVSGQSRLAELLHLSPETKVRAEATLAEEDVPRDLDRLYKQAISTRPELQAQLAAIHRDQQHVDLARLQYYPDVTLAAIWGGMSTTGALSPAADGLSTVNIGMQVNVPIYRKKLEAGVREAEAQAVASAREYDALKDRTQADVKDLFAQAESQRDLVVLFQNEIVPKAEQTLEVSTEAYRVGKTDFLQLLDNWRGLLQFRIALRRLESQLRQTLSTLERVVGGELSSARYEKRPENVGPPSAPPTEETNQSTPEALPKL